MTELVRTRDALAQCYDAIETLCARMNGEQWQVQSLCPDWRARDVVIHLGMMERVMSGWLPGSVEELPPFSRVEPYKEQVSTLNDASFAKRISEIFADRRADIAGLRDFDLSVPCWTPVGPKTYGRFLEIRVFDFWVHERDMTTPLGWPTDDTDPRAEIALAEVEGSLGYIVGKKIGLPDGASIVFRLTGPIKRDLSVVVDGRARQVDHIDNPDVTITTDTLTFIQLACGRIDPQTQIDTGKVTWTGNDDFGDRAARNLRFTM
ncbi:MAG TPA: maleylpyruvate isomerase family mycothiol-dependent enzyme [Streptosporangiaceae bacterium]|nr:maleylpyruvate isomerase family mycothiol-dependent enzyme [Streptosporangiaceae bacterium]